MDIVFNDYSLDGQFNAVEEFLLWMNKEWRKLFDYLKEHNIALYKKSDFYLRRITKDTSVQDLLRITGDPLVTKLRTDIINLAYSSPYWDEEGIQKTDLNNIYKCIRDDDLPNCFSEAIERDRVVLSVVNNDFLAEKYTYCKNEQTGNLTNLIDFKSFLNWLLDSEMYSVRYVFENYAFERKIKFAEITGKCYAEEALLQNDLTIDDMKSILHHILDLISALAKGRKTRFWDSLEDGIFEYRITISSGREFRLLFVQDEAIVFLNGFIKKEQKTPSRELDKAKLIKNAYFSR